MPYDPNVHHRRSIRLRDYDYAQAGAYFVTLCAHNRECFFGDIVDGAMRLNIYGDIVVECWNSITEHFENLESDAFVVVPNHLHRIVVLASVTEVKVYPTLGRVVAYFKYQSTKYINRVRDMPGVSIWQRNYYDHIIRNESSLRQIREYIANNPLRWEEDQLHPSNRSKG